MIKKIFYCVLSLTFFYTSLATAKETMPSWEGIYCNATTDICIKIDQQGIQKIGDDEMYDYAQGTFFSKKGNDLIITEDLDLYSPTDARFGSIRFELSSNGKIIKIIKPLEPEEEGAIKRYHYDITYGTYIKK